MRACTYTYASNTGTPLQDLDTFILDVIMVVINFVGPRNQEGLSTEKHTKTFR